MTTNHSQLCELVFLAPPAGFEPATHGLGTRRSEPVFDQVTLGITIGMANVFPVPSHDYGSPTVYNGHMTGGDR